MFTNMKPTPNRWQTISNKKVYENPWLIVEEDQVINPSGNPGIYGKVLFKNKAIAIIPVDQNDYTWIVGQYRYALKQYSWEIPMGGVPLEEDILLGAQRELKEETGITAGKWTQLLTIHTSNSVTDELGYTFLAENLILGAPQFDDTEDIQIKRLPFSKVVDLVMTEVITDSISVASILKLARIKGL